MLRGNAASSSDATRDLLMCNLLKLVNVLIQIPVPGRSNTTSGNRTRASVFSASADVSAAEMGGLPGPAESIAVDSPLTDFSKISQSLGQSGNVMTSTPNLPPPLADAAGQQTDEQKTETANAANASISSLSSTRNKPRSCTHYADSRNPDGELKEAALADIILGHPHIMVHFLQALSYCNSNTVAMLLGSSGMKGNMQETFTGIDPLSVGDGIFQILCTLNKKATDVKLVLKAVYTYLQSGFQGVRLAGISKLSEPLLWFVLRVLDCERAIKYFLDMGTFPLDLCSMEELK